MITASYHRHRPPTFYTLRIAIFIAINLSRGIRYIPASREDAHLPKGLEVLTGGVSIHILGALWLVTALYLAVGTFRPSWERLAWIASMLIWIYWGVGYFIAFAFFGADEWLSAVLYIGVGLLQVSFLPEKRDRRSGGK